jgi:predicted PurR-regulated permease PerM
VGGTTLAVLIPLVIYARGTITALPALTIAYILEPVVDALERRRVPRGLAILLLAAGIVVGASALVLWIVPRVVEQARQFVMSIDLEALKARLDPILGAYATSSTELIMKARERALTYLQENGTDLLMPVVRTLGSVTGVIFRTISRILELILIPVLSFYLLRDSKNIRRHCTELIPPKMRARVLGLFTDIDKVLRRFIRGQIIVSSILGVLYAIGLLIMGTPLAVPIGVLAFAASSRTPVFAFGPDDGPLLSFLRYGSWAFCSAS